MRVYSDEGHGGRDPGASGNGYKEKDLVVPISTAYINELKRHGVTTNRTRSGDSTHSLSSRYQSSNRFNAKLFTSHHINSFSNPSVSGVEVLYTSQSGKRHAQLVLSELMKTGLFKNNRGVKKRDNLAVLNGTRAPAILIEYGFISNKQEADMINKNKDVLGKAAAKGTLRYLGVSYKDNSKPNKPNTNTKPNVLYKVQLGAYRDRKNADRLLEDLKDKGFDGFIRLPEKDDLFRVQTGAYSIRSNANRLLDDLAKKGFKGFVVVEEREKDPIPAEKNSVGITVGDAKVIKTTPDNIYIPVLGDNLFRGGFYGVNGTFFDTNTAPVKSPNSCVYIAINRGKPISNNAKINGYPGKIARGTIHYNGERLGNRKVKNVNELPKGIDWAIGGFTIKPYMDFKNEQIPSSINYKTAHTYLGYDKKGYVYLIVKPNHLVYEIVPTLDKLGITQCILLDGGGSSQLNYRGMRHYSQRKINTALLLKRE